MLAFFTSLRKALRFLLALFRRQRTPRFHGQRRDTRPRSLNTSHQAKDDASGKPTRGKEKRVRFQLDETMNNPEEASVTPSEDQQSLLQVERAESPQNLEELDIDIEDSTAPLLAHEEAVDQNAEEEEADQKAKEEAAMDLLTIVNPRSCTGIELVLGSVEAQYSPNQAPSYYSSCQIPSDELCARLSAILAGN